MVSYESIYQARTALHNLIMEKWLAEDVLSVRWWSMVALIAISYLICFSLFDKRRLTELFLFGSLLTVGAVVYETVGVNYVLWVCWTPIFPIIPCLFVPYLTILPTYYMLIFQYTTTWRQFFLWNLVAVSAYSLVLVPIFIHFNIVKLDNWRPIYHIPMIFAIASLARAVTLLLVKIEQGQENMVSKSSLVAIPQPVLKPISSPQDHENES